MDRSDVDGDSASLNRTLIRVPPCLADRDSLAVGAESRLGVFARGFGVRRDGRLDRGDHAHDEASEHAELDEPSNESGHAARLWAEAPTNAKMLQVRPERAVVAAALASAANDVIRPNV